MACIPLRERCVEAAREKIPGLDRGDGLSRYSVGRGWRKKTGDIKSFEHGHFQILECVKLRTRKRLFDDTSVGRFGHRERMIVKAA